MSTITRKPSTFREAIHSTPGERIDRESGVISGVKVLGLNSSNGRKYAKDAVRKAAPMYEGARVFLNHSENERQVGDRWGKLHNVRVSGDGGLEADLKYAKAHPMTEQILEAIEEFNDFGLSHEVEGFTDKDEDGNVTVEEIAAVNSVDLVATPATTENLFESEGMTRRRTRRRKPRKSLREALRWRKLREAYGDNKLMPFGEMLESADGDSAAALKQAMEEMGPHARSVLENMPIDPTLLESDGDPVEKAGRTVLKSMAKAMPPLMECAMRETGGEEASGPPKTDQDHTKPAPAQEQEDPEDEELPEQDDERAEDEPPYDDTRGSESYNGDDEEDEVRETGGEETGAARAPGGDGGPAHATKPGGLKESAANLRRELDRTRVRLAEIEDRQNCRDMIEASGREVTDQRIEMLLAIDPNMRETLLESWTDSSGRRGRRPDVSPARYRESGNQNTTFGALREKIQKRK